MATPPFLVDADDEYRLDVATGHAGRAQFALSDRARALLVDDLDYGNRDVVPWVTARTLVLTGAAVPRDGRSNARDVSWSITGADGGREATETELEHLAAYLESIEVDAGAVETVREHVRATRLAEVVSPDAIRGAHERTQGLRDLARDL